MYCPLSEILHKKNTLLLMIILDTENKVLTRLVIMGNFNKNLVQVII